MKTEEFIKGMQRLAAQGTTTSGLAGAFRGALIPVELALLPEQLRASAVALAQSSVYSIAEVARAMDHLAKRGETHDSIPGKVERVMLDVRPPAGRLEECFR